ncbi:MAG: hypothetical protein GVY16_08410 [Planctomycetes bacterium]|nr:hypothetical protein [Planctomycetota bacterium]
MDHCMLCGTPIEAPAGTARIGGYMYCDACRPRPDALEQQAVIEDIVSRGEPSQYFRLGPAETHDPDDRNTAALLRGMLYFTGRGVVFVVGHEVDGEHVRNDPHGLTDAPAGFRELLEGADRVLHFSEERIADIDLSGWSQRGLVIQVPDDQIVFELDPDCLGEKTVERIGQYLHAIRNPLPPAGPPRR